MAYKTQVPGSKALEQRGWVGFWGVVAVLVGFGIYRGWSFRWLGDDAYISFRYALHLAEGKGLIFNLGEVVEGYTNFLWTVWMAIPLALGFSVEGWAHGWSLGSFGVSLGLLGWLSWKRWGMEGGRWVWPLGLVLAVGHREWLIYATSGLETSLYTCLLLGAFVCLGADDPRSSRFAWGGLLTAAAFLTRPDGAIFAVIAGVWLLLRWRGFQGPVWAFGTAAGLPALGFLAWRLVTYGDIVPNTYYAKSAYLTWYSQGWLYLRFFLQQYWPVFLGLPLFPLLWFWLLKRAEPSWKAKRDHVLWQGAFAFSFAAIYTLYVVRVGGDFMYGRFLIPVLPFALLCLEMVASFLLRPLLQAALGIGLFILLLTSSPSLQREGFTHGIADEWQFYQHFAPSTGMELKGRTLRSFFEGLPIRMAFVGSQARLVYHARPPVAIESITGLTDATIARLPLLQRGRIGHEKNAPPWYLLDTRKVHLIFFPPDVLGLDKEHPSLPIRFQTHAGSFSGTILTWETPLMRELQRRGAILPDLFDFLEDRLLVASSQPYPEVLRIYRGVWRLYFRQNHDPARHAPWQRLLEAKKPSPTSRHSPTP